MTKSSDIFKSCYSPGYLIAASLLLAAQFATYPLHEYLHVLFFCGTGILCIYNYQKCGRYHCKITGPGYFLLGILTLLNILGIVPFPWSWIWVIFAVITVTAFGLELYNKSRANNMT